MLEVLFFLFRPAKIFLHFKSFLCIYCIERAKVSGSLLCPLEKGIQRIPLAGIRFYFSLSLLVLIQEPVVGLSNFRFNRFNLRLQPTLLLRAWEV